MTPRRDDAQLANRGVDELGPDPVAFDGRKRELGRDIAAVRDQQQRLALDRTAAIVGFVGRVAVDQHAERVVVARRANRRPSSRDRRRESRTDPSARP